jgi:hypothetical protein
MKTNGIFDYLTSTSNEDVQEALNDVYKGGLEVLFPEIIKMIGIWKENGDEHVKLKLDILLFFSIIHFYIEHIDEISVCGCNDPTILDELEDRLKSLIIELQEQGIDADRSKS